MMHDLLRASPPIPCLQPTTAQATLCSVRHSASAFRHFLAIVLVVGGNSGDGQRAEPWDIVKLPKPRPFQPVLPIVGFVCRDGDCDTRSHGERFRILLKCGVDGEERVL